MTKDEALKLALDALEVCEQSNYGRNWVWPDTAHPTAMKNVREAITAIKEALSSCQCPECKVLLHASDCAVHNEPAYPKGECNCGAQPEQEPVAWMTHSNDLTPLFHKTIAGALNWQTQPKPLYTTPPQRKPLTDEQIKAIFESNMKHDISDAFGFARAIEAAVWEKQK